MPAAGFTGTATFSYTIADVFDGRASGDVVVTIGGAPPGGGSGDPVAAGDHVATQEGQSVVVDVLANDSDPDADPLVVMSVGSPATFVSELLSNLPASGRGYVPVVPDANSGTQIPNRVIGFGLAVDIAVDPSDTSRFLMRREVGKIADLI